MKFGQKAKDKITGFEGILTGKCNYITGCSQWLVSPPVKDGDFKEAKWIDEQRLEVIEGAEILVLDNGDNTG